MVGQAKRVLSADIGTDADGEQIYVGAQEGTVCLLRQAWRHHAMENISLQLTDGSSPKMHTSNQGRGGGGPMNVVIPDWAAASVGHFLRGISLPTRFIPAPSLTRCGAARVYLDF